jgi:PLP dependent protein
VSEYVTANIAQVRERIRAAAGQAGRGADDVKLIAVSKTHPAEVLLKAIASGSGAFGENKVQEAEGKIAAVGRDAAEWHLVGHLQSNKARKAVQLFDVIQSLDSVELAERLERICIEEGRGDLPVLVQVDLAGEDTKSGIDEADLAKLVEFLKHCERLKFTGLMILPPLFDDPEATRPYFVRLRGIRDRLAGQGVFDGGRGELSMGMSHDFEVAVEEGATMVRVGTAIFGKRS